MQLEGLQTWDHEKVGHLRRSMGAGELQSLMLTGVIWRTAVLGPGKHTIGPRGQQKGDLKNGRFRGNWSVCGSKKRHGGNRRLEKGEEESEKSATARYCAARSVKRGRKNAKSLELRTSGEFLLEAGKKMGGGG